VAGCVRTAVEPEHERLLVGRRGGLEEPVEERAAVGLVHGHVPGVLREPHGRLPREPRHAVRRLLRRGHGVHLRRRGDGGAGGEREGEREQQQGAGGGRHRRDRERAVRAAASPWCRSSVLPARRSLLVRRHIGPG
jgi:hypothetical protein